MLRSLPSSSGIKEMLIKYVISCETLAEGR